MPGQDISTVVRRCSGIRAAGKQKDAIRRRNPPVLRQTRPFNAIHAGTERFHRLIEIATRLTAISSAPWKKYPKASRASFGPDLGTQNAFGFALAWPLRRTMGS